MESFSTRGLKALFSFPFRKSGWEMKMVVLAGFSFAGMIIPVIPWLFVYGYIAELIRRAVDSEDPELPGWDDWNDLLVDGLRLMGASLFYVLPLLLLYGVGFGAYMAGMFGMVSLADTRLVQDWLPLFFGGGKHGLLVFAVLDFLAQV